MQKKLLDAVVIGTGLSSLTFIDAYLERKKKIHVISFKKNSKKKYNIKNKHIFKILPPQMTGKERQVGDYFQNNQIIVNKNCKYYGSMEFGGLSNYWGLQIDKNISGDIKHLTSKTKKNIHNAFVEIFKKLNLIGLIKDNKILLDNSYKKNDYISKEFFKKNKDLIVDEPILGFQKKSKTKIKLENINEQKDKLNPLNFFNKYLKKKNIIFHNYFVEKIENHKQGLSIICSDGEKKKIFLTKKLILGCGTLITTKLIMDYLNISKEVKINHHPRLFTLFFSKQKWKSKMQFQPSHLHLKSKKKPYLFTADFRPGNKAIINAVIKFKFFLLPFKFVLNILKEHLIFSNIFLESSYGNLYIKKKNKVFEVYSKNRNINHIFKKVSNMIYKFLLKTKKIIPFFIHYFPGYGADFHYFGTILMGKKNSLSVNEKCQLNQNKNIYLIDGSVFNFKKNKYPLGLIMANSRRIGKEI